MAIWIGLLVSLLYWHIGVILQCSGSIHSHPHIPSWHRLHLLCTGTALLFFYYSKHVLSLQFVSDITNIYFQPVSVNIFFFICMSTHFMRVKALVIKMHKKTILLPENVYFVFNINCLWASSFTVKQPWYFYQEVLWRPVEIKGSCVRADLVFEIFILYFPHSSSLACVCVCQVKQRS